MKKIIAILVMIAIPFLVFAQSAAPPSNYKELVKSFFDHYAFDPKSVEIFERTNTY